MSFQYITGISKRQMITEAKKHLNDIENRVRSCHTIETIEDCRAALNQVKRLEGILESLRWKLPDKIEEK